MKSKDWLKRQNKDIFVIKSKQKGYLSRSAFKLFEIEDKFKLLKKSSNAFEFGAAPGGWSQALIEINPNIKITSIDLLDLKFIHPNILFYKQDFNNFNYEKINKKFDAVLSDIAPNTTGHSSTDHLRISSMVLVIIDTLKLILKDDGCFITKIWKGSEESIIIKKLKNKFKKVKYFKPNSSRKISSEIFLVAQKYIS